MEIGTIQILRIEKTKNPANQSHGKKEKQKEKGSKLTYIMTVITRSIYFS